ncbi:MAG: cation:proton antiporter [Candidatus Omnitrophota bacterium]|nr:cation:proton antiporter [Candidatus Omnitrophota bacterium]
MKKLTILILFLFLLIPFVNLYAGGADTNVNLVDKMAMLVFQLSVIIFASHLGGKVFEKFHFPAVLGELVSGMIIGPYLLGGIGFLGFLGFSNGLFPINGGFPVSFELYSFATIASIVLLFLVGLETNIETFLSFSLAGSVVGVGGVFVSFILGDLAAVIFSKYVFGAHYGFTHPIPLFLGVISTATSVGISARILSEKKKMDSPEGVTILSGAVIDDVLGIILLAIVIGIIKSGHVAWKEVGLISLKAIGIWLGLTAVGLYFSSQISDFLKKFKDKSTIAVMSFALALALAGVFEKSGLALIVGAYVMGLSLSKTDLSFVIQENLSSLYKFFVPIFFCVMGMLVNFHEMVSSKIIIFGLIYVVFAVLGKILGCSVPALFLNFNLRGAIRVGLGMIPRGEVALIIAGIGLSAGFLQHEAFSVAIVMTFITTLFTPPLLAKMFDSDKSGLRREKPVGKEYKQIVYSMPNPETAKLILGNVIMDFEGEGFFVHLLGMEQNLYQIRKKHTFITMKASTEKIEFDCLAKDEIFIHTLFYEVLADLEHTMKQLKALTDREKIGRKIFGVKNGVAAQKLEISQVVSPLAVEVALKGVTKQAIIEELLDILIKAGQLSSVKRKQALSDLLDREETMSTGMQDGIALPHAKSLAVKSPICAIGLKKEGLDFDALDKKLSKIFILTLSPVKSLKPYLQFMAEISKFFVDKENRDKVLSCNRNDKFYEILTSRI